MAALIPEDDPEAVQAFIKAQIQMIDNLLLNAYGTVYKVAAKQLVYRSSAYDLSPIEEILSAKNLFSNLWSILDFCCTILYSHYNNKLPDIDPKTNIKFPVHFATSSFATSSFEWERKAIEKVLNKNVTDDSLKDIFHHVQFKGETANSN